MQPLALLQSLDSARYQSRDDHIKNLATARIDVVQNLLFGRKILVPEGSFADSLAFFTIITELLQSKPKEIDEKYINKPLFVCGYSNNNKIIDCIKHFWSQNNFFSSIYESSNIKHMQNFSEIRSMVINENWHHLADTIGLMSLGDGLSIISKNNEYFNLKKPILNDVNINYIRTLEKTLKFMEKEANPPSLKFHEIKACFDYMKNNKIALRRRSEFYRMGSRVFGDYWYSLRDWVDATHFRIMAMKYGPKYTAYRTYEKTEEKFLVLDHFINKGASMYERIFGKIEWEEIWAVMSERRWKDSVDALNSLQRGDKFEARNYDEYLERHIEIVASCLKSITFCKRGSRISLTPTTIIATTGSAMSVGGSWALSSGIPIISNSILPYIAIATGTFAMTMSPLFSEIMKNVEGVMIYRNVKSDLKTFSISGDTEFFPSKVI
ncbi:MAG: hypothetical protein HC871_02020 [Rhizobiales bacterium]|nr:hypothetical protein [Hyphomicrobiales bacterium]